MAAGVGVDGEHIISIIITTGTNCGSLFPWSFSFLSANRKIYQEALIACGPATDRPNGWIVSTGSTRSPPGRVSGSISSALARRHVGGPFGFFFAICLRSPFYIVGERRNAGSNAILFGQEVPGTAITTTNSPRNPFLILVVLSFLSGFIYFRVAGKGGIGGNGKGNEGRGTTRRTHFAVGPFPTRFRFGRS